MAKARSSSLTGRSPTGVLSAIGGQPPTEQRVIRPGMVTVWAQTWYCVTDLLKRSKEIFEGRECTDLGVWLRVSSGRAFSFAVFFGFACFRRACYFGGSFGVSGGQIKTVEPKLQTKRYSCSTKSAHVRCILLQILCNAQVYLVKNSGLQRFIPLHELNVFNKIDGLIVFFFEDGLTMLLNVIYLI